jgi:hypothetical protein
MLSIKSQEVRTETYQHRSRNPGHRIGYHQFKLEILCAWRVVSSLANEEKQKPIQGNDLMVKM